MSSVMNILKRPTTILRVTIILFSCMVAVLLGFAFRLTGEAADYEYYADGLGPATVGMCYTAVAWSITWSAIALGLAFGNLNVHPGVDVGLDFFSFGLNVGFAGSLIAFFSSFDNMEYFCTEARRHPDDFYNYEERCRQSKEIKGEIYSSGAFLIFVGLCHLAVFIIACRATHIRRTQSKRSSFQELGPSQSRA